MSQVRYVLAVCKDPGGTNTILSVVKALEEKDCCAVKLIANGKAVETLTDAHIEFEEHRTVESVLRMYTNPALLITSMCSDGGIGRDLVPLLRGKCPSIAVSGYWGEYVSRAWRENKYRPDYMCVNDHLGIQITKKAWPDFDQFSITGFPMFDQYTALNLSETRDKVYSTLGLNKDYSLILFPCGIISGASALLKEVLLALTDIDKTSYLVPRLHPRTKDEAPQELECWDNTISQYRKEKSCRIIDSPGLNIKELIASATVVLSDYSTVLVEAALLRKPNISILYLDAARSEFEREYGELMNEPPFVSLGCSARATSRVSLRKLIMQSITKIHDPLGLRVAQEKHLQTDGNNARRVANLVRRLISQ